MQQIINLSCEILKVHPRNQEFFDDIDGETYERFKESIMKDGVITPIIVAPDMIIISGHQRYKACRDLGIAMIPAIINEDLIDENIKLRQLIASNFGRLKNDPEKMRTAVLEYRKLVGNQNGGDRKSEDQVDLLKKDDLEKTAKDLGISIGELKRILSIQKKLIPELRQAMDKGFISKTAALGITSKLEKHEQQELLTELTKLIGEKQGKVLNSEVDSLVEEIQTLKEEHQKTIERNTELLTKLSQAEALKNKLEEMEEELKNRPVVETEKEVVPEDYEKVKQRLESSGKDYRMLKEEYDKRVKELNELKQQIKAMTDLKPEEQYSKKLKEDAILFCAKINNFISQVGGLAYLSNNIKELPPNEQKAYIKCVELVEQWAFAVKANLQQYI